MRVLKVMHDKTKSTMQQGIGTNNKSLQMHENNHKSLQKQHGYKSLNTSLIMSHRNCDELGTYILVT